MIYNHDCREVIECLDDNSIDALVTDPPYGLAFMGKAWDKTLPDPEIWRSLLRVHKPGAHGVIFGAPRLYHRLACHVEDAGWEIRDCMQWLFGTGFPKGGNTTEDHGILLKPAYEPILLVRKPFKGSVIDNALEHGTGVLNIAACRIGESGGTRAVARSTKPTVSCLGAGLGAPHEQRGEGRWPANVLLDEEAAALLDAQSGVLKSGSANITKVNAGLGYGGGGSERVVVGSEGGASRFFYCAKASRAEREAGLEHLPSKTVGDGRAVAADNAFQRGKTERHNTHTTVKPISLMQYLVRLITPLGGTVFDPFAGSGTTGIACALEGREFIGAELDPEYTEIGNARIEYWKGKGA